EVGRRAGRQFHFMIAKHAFAGHGGFDGFMLQRLGGFSVDREGCDRASMRQAGDLLTSGKTLVIFPEGEIYHTNERLTPLREGVAFMAVTAQRDLEKAKSTKRVWVVPTCIRYKYEQDITPRLAESVSAMDRRFLGPSFAGQPLAD